MGLTNRSTGSRTAAGEKLVREEGDILIALAGNPNVGKSTVFNCLTGLKQHTGNWTGKTVTNAFGECRRDSKKYVIADLPGTYSLAAHSEEEAVARDFICFGGADSVVIVCDATCLERNLNLVLQTLEITRAAAVCVNLIDEAERRGVKVDLSTLSKRLGVPVIATDARRGKGVGAVLDSVGKDGGDKPFKVEYPDPLASALDKLEPSLKECKLPSRWLALKLLEGNEELLAKINEHEGVKLAALPNVASALEASRSSLKEHGLDDDGLADLIVGGLIKTASDIYAECVDAPNDCYDARSRKIDRFITGRVTGTLIMLAALLVILWLTITGANYPSELLSRGLMWLGEVFNGWLVALGTPELIRSALIDGVWRVLAWVTAVMLPPMAIFFPLFTLLEDAGFLPRIAFNLDGVFKRCNACGKQALTMCMGFGCNAAGVVGCRIIDSPREKFIAILTNNFVPCNGRFPMMIALISMFFVVFSGVLGSLISAAVLTAVIVFGIIMTFAMSKFLSATVLKGTPSKFTLELPPYRKPQFLRVIVRSIFDRTLFVFSRAAAVAAPAGLIIWLMANVTVMDTTLLAFCSEALDPFARLFGMDGVILMAFILGMPANEIVLPLIAMAYMSNATLTEVTDLAAMQTLFTANGWTAITALCVIVFSLMHWPCTTTLLTVKKETGSLKWTAVAFLLPTVCGLVCCFVIANIARLFGL